MDTIVLEAAQPGWGASGRNGGFCSPGGAHMGYDEMIDAASVLLITEHMLAEDQLDAGNHDTISFVGTSLTVDGVRVVVDAQVGQHPARVIAGSGGVRQQGSALPPARVPAGGIAREERCEQAVVEGHPDRPEPGRLHRLEHLHHRYERVVQMICRRIGVAQKFTRARTQQQTA